MEFGGGRPSDFESAVSLCVWSAVASPGQQARWTTDYDSLENCGFARNMAGPVCQMCARIRCLEQKLRQLCVAPAYSRPVTSTTWGRRGVRAITCRCIRRAGGRTNRQPAVGERRVCVIFGFLTEDSQLESPQGRIVASSRDDASERQTRARTGLVQTPPVSGYPRTVR